MTGTHKQLLTAETATRWRLCLLHVHRYGRKATMMAGGACFLTGTVLVTLAVHMVMLVLGRIVLGIGVGFATQVGCRTVTVVLCVEGGVRQQVARVCPAVCWGASGAPLGRPSVASPPPPAGPWVWSSKQTHVCDCSVWCESTHAAWWCGCTHGWCWWCCLPAGHPSLLV